MTDLFVSLFDDALSEFAYDSSVAGLQYDFSVSVAGIKLTIQGFNDKLHSLLAHIMDKMTSFVVSPDRFALYKEEEKGWTYKEELQCLEQVTIETLTEFISVFLRSVFLEALVYGNVTEQGALELLSIVEEPLVTKCHLKPLPKAIRHNRQRAVKLPEGSKYLYEEPDLVHESSGILRIYECGVSDSRVRGLCALFQQTIFESFYDVLRTQEQLGYIVDSSHKIVGGVRHFHFLVQSEKSPVFVESRIDKYLDTVEESIVQMTDDEFDKIRKAVITIYEDKPMKLGSQFQEYWYYIEYEIYQFDTKEAVLAFLRKCTKDDMLQFARRAILPTQTAVEDKRKQLSVHVTCKAHKEEQEKEDGDPVTAVPIPVVDRCQFKASLPLHPLPPNSLDVHLTRTKAKL